MFNKKTTYIITTAMALLGLLFYLSLNSLLAFVGFATFMAMPILLGIMQLASVILCVVFTLHKPNKIASIVLFIWNVIFLILSIALLIVFKNSISDILMQGLKIFFIMLAVMVVVFIIFYLPKLNIKYKKIVSIILCVVISLGIIVGFTDLKNLQINYIKQGAVAYAVGEDYQIVWTTKVKGTGYVTIGGLTFYDTLAGSMITEQRVHKVIVPQDVLNEAKRYTVNTRKMVAEQGFYATQGGTVSRSYDFRPVDESDGIQYFALADSHDHNKVAAKPASYFGSKTDFVIMAGDIVSFLENDTDLNRIVNLAYLLTKGNIPVVFARGNHELKSEKAEQLHRYVGADGTNFYYTFRLGSVWGVVLDMGEDHEDSWYEFYGTALFADYRKAQTDFLANVMTNAENEHDSSGVTLKLGICHIATAFSPIDNDYMYQDLININSYLNQMDIKCMISGHLHQIFITENNFIAGMPLTYHNKYNDDQNPVFVATGANYYNVITSASSRTQNGKIKLGKYFCGAAFEFVDNGLTIKFVNDKLQVVPTLSAFEDRNYGKEINI